ALPRLTPDERVRERRALLDDLLRPHLHVRTDDRVVTDLGAIRDDGLLADDGAFADDHVAAAHGFRQARRLADAAPLPEHDVAQVRPRSDLDVRADHDVLEADTRSDLHVAAENRGTGDAHVPADGCARLAPEHAAFKIATLAAQRDAHAPRQDVLVRAPVFLDIADVAPVAIRDVTVERGALREHRGEQVLGEVDVGPLRYARNRFRLEDVDAGVDRVAEDLAPRRPLEEALNPAACAVDNDDIVCERVFDGRERDGRLRAPALVIGNGLAEIEVGQHITADHDHALARDQVPGVPHGAGGTVVRIRRDVFHS